jgi:hypothetical protein
MSKKTLKMCEFSIFVLFLTITGRKLGAHTFSFPNYVIKKLYSDYFFLSILEAFNTEGVLLR